MKSLIFTITTAARELTNFEVGVKLINENTCDKT